MHALVEEACGSGGSFHVAGSLLRSFRRAHRIDRKLPGATFRLFFCVTPFSCISVAFGRHQSYSLGIFRETGFRKRRQVECTQPWEQRAGWESLRPRATILPVRIDCSLYLARFSACYFASHRYPVFLYCRGRFQRVLRVLRIQLLLNPVAEADARLLVIEKRIPPSSHFYAPMLLP